jgi:Cu2+-exporting ATPase
MTKVHQNLAWAVAYNIVAIPVAAGALLPQFDFAMTPSLSGKVYLVNEMSVVAYANLVISIDVAILMTPSDVCVVQEDSWP